MLVLALLIGGAFGIRILHANEPPLNFHATRQYRSLIIARGFFLTSLPSVPEWEKRVALFSQGKQGILEPPIMELVVSTGYRLLGGEVLWLPHVLSSIFWLTGAVFLYLIGKTTFGPDAALFGAAFYLFLPFAVVASQSFQPDPLMVALMLASIWAILRYHQAPSAGRLALATALAACAFVTKPSALFVIATTFATVTIGRQGVRALWGRASLVFYAFVLMPTLLIYAYGVLTDTFLVGEAEKTLLPGLWFSSFFWHGWLANISGTVGLFPFFAALLAVPLLRNRETRALVAGLWLGYGAFCLMLNYNVATHDYYQLQLVPIISLSIMTFAKLALEQFPRLHLGWQWRAGAWVVLGVALLLALADARGRLANPTWKENVASKQAIGNQVHHSTKTIFLSGDYGVPLEYHGLLSGSPWPLASDLEWEEIAGTPRLSASERYRTWFAVNSPTYFIVEDMEEFERQSDLKQYLMQNYEMVAQTDAYYVFDLRESNER